MRVDALEQEGDRAAAGVEVAWSVDREPILEAGGERVERVAGQRLLVRADRVEADRGEVVDGGPEADRLGDRRGAGLELPGHVVGREAVDVDVADHLATAEERRHRVEELGARPEAADPGGPEHLVAGETDEVGVPLAHVDGEVRDGLRGVDEDLRPRGVRGVGERPDLVDRAEHVRHRGDGEQPGAVEETVEVGEVEAVVGGQRDPAQLDAALGGEDVPRHDVGVVLHLREHDGVAGLRGWPAPTSTRRG